MVTSIQRWGNSLAIRIPKPFASQAGLSEDTDVEIVLQGDRIVISPAKKQWKLEKLLAGISPSNKHRAIEWGRPRGGESW
ncbi:MAG TPA: AbrB/MazE/SpoVT family DNA-binding domain-containing protein [Gemmatimonadaceae bacterium]